MKKIGEKGGTNCQDFRTDSIVIKSTDSTKAFIGRRIVSRVRDMNNTEETDVATSFSNIKNTRMMFKKTIHRWGGEKASNVL